MKAPPNAENVRPCANYFSLIEKQLEETGESKQRAISAFDSYMACLKNVGKYYRLESRIQFMVRGVMEPRENKWSPRREEVQIMHN